MAQSADEVASYFDDHFKDQMRHHSASAATTFEINQHNVMEVFNVHCRLMEIEKSSDSLENKQDAMHRAVGGMLKEIVFSTGDAGAKRVKGTPIEPYENLAAELRDGELLQLATGMRPSTIEGIEKLTLPPPHKKDDPELRGISGPN